MNSSTTISAMQIRVQGASCLSCAGCEDALIPHGGLQRDVSDPRDLEKHNEEVRLLYVGMTRAKQQLYLLHAKERALRGGLQRSAAKISPFLKSIPGVTSSKSAQISKSISEDGQHGHRHFHRVSGNGHVQVVEHQASPPSRTNHAGLHAPQTPARIRAARRRR